MTTSALRTAFAAGHRDVLLLDEGDARQIEAYLLARALAQPYELPARVERAGEGNMNLTLRVTLRDRRIIVKQGRAWVAKYDHIPAPWDRTLVEAAFYEAVAALPQVSSRMPRLLHVDRHNHVLVLEDLGTAGDYTSVYRDGEIPDRDLQALLLWLAAVGRVGPHERSTDFTNRAMRQLNHEHIFALPLRAQNGLDLDRITDGLGEAADDLKGDRAYGWRVTELGEVYLSDGPSLVHGDYFPGSWIRTPEGVRIIDPEFCFFGAREFDYGVMLAHCALARMKRDVAERVIDAARRADLDAPLVLGFAGVEIMRRLIGVAQLPISVGMDQKWPLLDLSHAFVLSPERGLTSWS